MIQSKLAELVIEAEDAYKISASKEKRKEEGQFFTPSIVADWMAEWIIKNNPKEILEPSFGFGSLAVPLIRKKIKANIIGIEKDSVIFKKIPSELKKVVDLRNIDFFNLDEKTKYDAIISNPPYVRHHSLNLNEAIYKKYEAIINNKISKMANLYILFCIDIIHRLKENGRAAIIIPTEWMNSNFGVTFKKFLFDTNLLSSIIYISHNSTVFDDALTTASILLIENNRKNKLNLDFFFVSSKDFFIETNPNQIKANNSFIKFNYDWKKLLSTKKWDSLLNTNKNSNANKTFTLLSDHCSSKRGIATGANNYFLISNHVIDTYSISTNSLKKCIGSAMDIKGLIFNEKDLNKLVSDKKKVFLFDAADQLSDGDINYLEYGKKLKIDKRYLTSKRTKWYVQEKRKPSPIWACVFNRQNIRFIYNDTETLNLTTFHCLYPKFNLSKIELKALVAILNHNEMVPFIMEQRRVYGGGLVKLEPKDLLDIRIPNFTSLPKKIINELACELDEADKCFRAMTEYKFNISLAKILSNCEQIKVTTMIQQELL